jgi:anti-anti-sigma factor
MDGVQNKFQIIKKDFYTLIKINDDKLDTFLAPALKSELVLLASSMEKNIIMDLSNVKYCDSSGLSAILVANRLCKNADGIFILTGLQPTVERLISISQLDSVLNIADTLEEAEQLVKQHLKYKPK